MSQLHVVIDDVIEPKDSRRILIKVLEITLSKSVLNARAQEARPFTDVVRTHEEQPCLRNY